MSKFNELRRIRESGTVSGSRHVVDITTKIQNSQGDRVPDEVWQLMQEAGLMASQHLVTLLDPLKFEKLNAKDQRALISLALDRAYGRADPGVKRSVQVQLSASGNDAVAASLARLDAQTMLPEYNNPTAQNPKNGGNDEK